MTKSCDFKQKTKFIKNFSKHNDAQRIVLLIYSRGRFNEDGIFSDEISDREAEDVVDVLNMVWHASGIIMSVGKMRKK
ncbi:hypothetical protein C0583_03000 [Candidatus Parcubacteria bacterium]|nr:MAG: hypothetical protein C0583_03000 [Candidatus Parcubacteria bacterium]